MDPSGRIYMNEIGGGGFFLFFGISKLNNAVTPRIRRPQRI